MSGPAKSKIPIKCDVYVHLVDASTGSKIEHIDVESPLLAEIIRPKEATYCAGKPGGAFIGLKKPMLERLRKKLKEQKAL